MKFAELNKEFLLRAYLEDKESTHSIADKLNTYPNKVVRALKSLGVTLRDKSEAQRTSLESGRQEHPTKGKQRSEDVKAKISDSVHKYWKELTDEEREERSLVAKEQWDKMSEAEKDNLRRLAAEAVRDAAKNGSKMEVFLKDELANRGYEVIFHKKGLIVNQDLEIDLYLPTVNVAIEIDGPAHFFPIWGEANLKKHISADARKAGLLLNEGVCLIRVKHLSKTFTNKNRRDVLEALVNLISKIEAKFPPKNKRYFELEVD